MAYMWDEILEQPLTLKRCLEKNKTVIKDIVKQINENQVDKVVLAARGTSDHAAVYGKYVIELLTGLPVSLAAPSVFTIYKHSMNFRNTLVIGISQSGQAADVLEVIRCANKNGGITVGITNDCSSPIAVESGAHLYCAAGIEKSVAATKTFTAQLCLLLQLAAEWNDNDELRSEIVLIPEKINRTFDVANAVESGVIRYSSIDECFVLARGANYAVSLEAALKIQETTYVRARAFATSDFQHGPKATLDRGIPVMVFAPEGPSLKDVTEMIRILRDSRIETIIVSNNKAVLDLGTTSFPIPYTDNDMISPFLNAVVAQMFACRLALAKGLNPDAPRGLNKVTITL